jgi:hypothetical protein
MIALTPKKTESNTIAIGPGTTCPITGNKATRNGVGHGFNAGLASRRRTFKDRTRYTRKTRTQRAY